MGKHPEPIKALGPNHGINVLHALRNQRTQSDKKLYDRKSYEEYIADPLGIEYKKSLVQKNVEIHHNNVAAETMKAKIEKLQLTMEFQREEELREDKSRIGNRKRPSVVHEKYDDEDSDDSA